ncbi:MAG: stage 0 sporulation family protein [Anaerolineales bacterium]|nr:MAG: stage 0 sporulation family protein [Anaerolineales bacterium]
MTLIVGVRFKPATKIYYFDPRGVEDLQEGAYVVVETSRARELARVVIPPKEVPQQEIVGQLKPVLRTATSVDLANAEYHARREQQALEECQEKVVEYGLPIKVIRAEYNYDGSHLVFFFTSEQRVDFRALVRDLARVFRTRIELRQIGVRDEAKLVDGVGPCGRELCCTTHLCEFIPVSIKMAKQQNLPLSPMEISGMCGRLLCCLTYEDEYYREAKQKMPRAGEIVRTADGVGKVTGYNVLKETVQVELESGIVVEVPLAGIRPQDTRRSPRRRGAAPRSKK